MKSYFIDALNALKEDVVAFASPYPRHFRALNLDSLEDPDRTIERLLEGFAFLSGRIKHQLDNGLVELSQQLIDTLYLSVLQPTPSKCIVQFACDELNKPQTISAAEVSINTIPVGDEKTECSFSLMHDVTLLPFSISNVEQYQDESQYYVLKICLKSNEGISDFELDEIDFYVNGDTLMKRNWFYSVFHLAQHAELICDNQKQAVTVSHDYLNKHFVKHSAIGGVALLKELM